MQPPLENPKNRGVIRISLKRSYLQILPDTNIFVEIARNKIALEEELNRLLYNPYQIALHPLILRELDHLILQASTNKKPLFRLAKQLALQYPMLENIY